ncbi:helix-turn-helix domain-containing protein [Amycolatopsis sp. cg5]|uniref:helix-turn-helix domain-containing protein n=1 Tax=Amycolatopsis sp. cg5 TaxID=3238802 RepID=UPI0035238A29
MANGARRCTGCRCVLAVDNTAALCSKCLRDQRDQLLGPPRNLRPEFFDTDEFRRAFNSQQIGNVFKAYRHHPRWLKLLGKALNQEVLGRWLGLNQGQVSKLENGKDEDNIKVLREYATILCLPHDELWFRFPNEGAIVVRGENGSAASGFVFGWQDPAFEASIKQLGQKAAGAALVALAASESAAFGLRHQVAEIHSSTMEQIEEEVRRLSIDFIAADPLNTFLRSRRLRDDIFTLLDQRAFPQQQALLYGYAARTCGYLAAAASDFYGKYEAASDQCRVARQFSEVANIPELRSWVLGIESGIAFWRDDWKRAANLAERSLQLAVTRSGVMRATSMRARALARLGNREQLHEVISASEASSIDGTSDDENGMILFSEDNHLRCLGTANLWVGESHQAREQLSQALTAYLANAPENFAVIAVIRADIAQSFLMERNVDGAAEALAPLYEVDTNMRLEGALRRMRNLSRILQSENYKSSIQARELVVNIDSFTAGVEEQMNQLPEDA